MAQLSNNAPTSLRAQIESLWAAGVKPDRIAFMVNTKPSYVDQVIYFANRRPTPVSQFAGDDDKHLELIFQANKGMGFPYCVAARRAA